MRDYVFALRCLHTLAIYKTRRILAVVPDRQSADALIDIMKRMTRAAGLDYTCSRRQFTFKPTGSYVDVKDISNEPVEAGRDDMPRLEVFDDLGSIP